MTRIPHKSCDSKQSVLTYNRLRDHRGSLQHWICFRLYITTKKHILQSPKRILKIIHHYAQLHTLNILEEPSILLLHQYTTLHTLQPVRQSYHTFRLPTASRCTRGTSRRRITHSLASLSCRKTEPNHICGDPI